MDLDHYDEMDMESVLIHGGEEEEEMDAEEAAFMRGYLGVEI
jgi:hypothetical protein